MWSEGDEGEENKNSNFQLEVNLVFNYAINVVIFYWWPYDHWTFDFLFRNKGHYFPNLDPSFKVVVLYKWGSNP